jgi:hypothetical protein
MAMMGNFSFSRSRRCKQLKMTKSGQDNSTCVSYLWGVYKYFTKHSSDASFASQPEESNPAARERRQREIEELREILEEAFDLQDLTNDMTPLHKLNKFWAQKKNRTYLALYDKVADKLARMFMAG